jgi:hypothetical protein
MTSRGGLSFVSESRTVAQVFKSPPGARLSPTHLYLNRPFSLRRDAAVQIDKGALLYRKWKMENGKWKMENGDGSGNGIQVE